MAENCTREELSVEFPGDIVIDRSLAKEDPRIDTASIEGWDSDKVVGRLIVTENSTAKANGLFERWGQQK